MKEPHSYGQMTNKMMRNQSSIDASLLQEQSCQISSQSDLKQRSLRLFCTTSPQQEQQQQQDK